ncbi:hypothetical protein [Desulfofustis limnaeus]|jgi:hypothetical protein|nr:hypothetical protein [Desulfofustis limnaeus]
MKSFCVAIDTTGGKPNVRRIPPGLGTTPTKPARKMTNSHD